jgi:hypothetical protein
VPAGVGVVTAIVVTVAPPFSQYPVMPFSETTGKVAGVVVAP